jgi:Cu/Ag efflux protein CusF
MRAWHVVVVLNLALVLGAGWGYAWWGRRVDRIATELAETQARAERLERELAAARADAPARRNNTSAPEQLWSVRGVIRAVLPEINVVVITHEDIPGYMPSMTMGFRAAAPKVYEGVHVGEDVRFTLRGTPPNDVVITAIRAAN